MTDEYTAWKASQARPLAESVRKTVGRLRQREAALEELASRYDGLKATGYDKTVYACGICADTPLCFSDGYGVRTFCE